MEPYIDQEIEEMLARAGKAMRPDRTRLQSVLEGAVAEKPARSHLLLSPLSLTFFMNTTSKVLAGLVAVVVVVGGGLYVANSSHSAMVADNTGTVPSGSSQTGDQGMNPAQPSATPSYSAPAPVQGSDAVADAINDVNASIETDVNNQNSAISALDQSTNADVSAADAGSSSDQPYNENSI
jgi:hypothetical protein